MLTYWEILTAIQSDIPIYDSYAKLWGEKLSNVYTTTTYTGTLPAVLTGTKAGYLHRHKVYGNVGGCGERTENLLDMNRTESTEFTLDTTKYIKGAIADTKQTMPQNVTISDYDATNNSVYVKALMGNGIGFIVECKPNTTYTLKYNKDKSIPSNKTSGTLNAVSTSGNLGTFWGIYGDDDSSTFTTGSTAEYIFIVLRCVGEEITYSNIMLVEGSTAPSTYIPYGYKLPLASGNTPVDIFIGDDTLSTEEYIDSSTRKIYRMVDGVLTPVDPPVPFPQIPTSANSTTINWDGEGIPPSQVEFTYKAKR